MSQQSLQEIADQDAQRRLRQRRRRAFWLAPRWSNLAISGLYVIIPILFFYYPPRLVGPTLWWREILITGAVLILLAIDRVEYRVYGEATPARMAAALLVARIILVECIAQIDSFRFSPFLYLIVPFLAVLYFGNLAGYGLAVLAWAVYILKHMLNSPGWLSDPVEIQYFATFSAGLVFVIALAQVVVRERASRARAEHLLAELAVSHQQLKAYAEQVEELAAAKERNRLARDIHDSLGHYLTVINVQLEKALAFRAKKPQEADQAVSAAKGLASEALHDVRRSVSALRAPQDVFSAQTAIGALVKRMQSSQFTIQLQQEGSEAGFASDVLSALYRAVQEGLTNIQKHARASQASVALRFDAQEATLLLRDNGRGFDPALLRQLAPGRQGGYGLQGVRERLELVGGQLQVESQPGAGTRLIASAPRQLRAQAEPVPAQIEEAV